MLTLAIALLSCALRTGPANDAVVVGPDERRVEAQAHHQRGRQHFQSEDFVAAAVEFAQAHRLYAAAAEDPGADPAVRGLARTSLSNAATSWSRASAPVEARDAFRLLLAEYGADLPPADRAAVEAATARLDDRIGELAIRGLPPRAEVRVDGRLVTVADERSLPVAAGSRSVDVRADHFKPWSGAVTVLGRASATLEVRLVPSDLPAQVRIESTVEPALVEIDGDPAGRAPVEKILPPGVHRYRVTAENHHPESGTFEILPNERTRLRVAPSRARGALGVRIEAALRFTYPLRGDTPLNVTFGDPLAFDDGMRLALGGTARLYYAFDRRQSYRLGGEVRYENRPLNSIGFGTTALVCPAGWELGKDGEIRLCPFGVTFGRLLPTGAVGPFGSGESYFAYRAAAQASEGLLDLGLALSLGYEPYERGGLRTLGVWMAALEFAVGFNL